MNNLIGQTFNRLTVLERVEGGKKGCRWLCKCSCGNEKIVYGHYLKNGHVKSCGCLKQKNGTKPPQIMINATDDGFLALRIGIINQACNDWRNGSRQYRATIEKFLLSDWGQFISGDMGEAIIKNLKEGR